MKPDLELEDLLEKIRLDRQRKPEEIKDPWKKEVFRAIGYEPNYAQSLFHNSTAKEKIFCAGTRTGKSKAAAAEMCCYLLQPNKVVWIVAPTYDLGEKEFRYVWHSLITRLRYKTDSRVYNKRAGDMRIRFPWGSEISVKSVIKPESLLGEEIDLACISEAAAIRNGTEIWNRFLRERLLSRNGNVIIPTTPLGYDDFLYPWFVKGLDKKNRITDSWEFPTWVNPYISINLIRRAFKELPWEVFLEQYMGKFTASGRKAFPEFSIDEHVKPWSWFYERYNMQEVPEEWIWILGIDYGYAVDPFVCIWTVVTPDEYVIVWKEYVMKQKPLSFHVDHINRFLPANRRRVSILLDSSVPGIRRELLELGLFTIPATKERESSLALLREYIANNKLVVMDTCPETIKTLLRYEETMKSGDDIVDALRYIIKTRPRLSTVPVTTDKITYNDILRRIRQNRKLIYSQNKKRVGYQGGEYGFFNTKRV